MDYYQEMEELPKTYRQHYCEPCNPSVEEVECVKGPMCEPDERIVLGRKQPNERKVAQYQEATSVTNEAFVLNSVPAKRVVLSATPSLLPTKPQVALTPGG